jgi:vacuolar-type H+-ATPase subunit F/Vma7
MAVLAVIGERTQVEGWALAGALVATAETPDQVRAAWSQLLSRDVGAVLLTPAAAAALTTEPGRRGPYGPVVAVLPQPRVGGEHR